MSLIIGVFVVIALLAGLISTLVAILIPRIRAVAFTIASKAFATAGAAIGMFVFIVWRMS